eukprot:SAG11_NODE_39_length_21630_cov_11.188658_6_plen_149_part_00
MLLRSLARSHAPSLPSCTVEAVDNETGQMISLRSASHTHMRLRTHACLVGGLLQLFAWVTVGQGLTDCCGLVVYPVRTVARCTATAWLSTEEGLVVEPLRGGAPGGRSSMWGSVYGIIASCKRSLGPYGANATTDRQSQKHGNWSRCD